MARVIYSTKSPAQEYAELIAESDYRTTDTQAQSWVRHKLAEPTYLQQQNRINLGPDYAIRKYIADTAAEIPHLFGVQSMWGWNDWLINSFEESITLCSLTSNLFIVIMPVNDVDFDVDPSPPAPLDLDYLVGYDSEAQRFGLTDESVNLDEMPWLPSLP